MYTEIEDFSESQNNAVQLTRISGQPKIMIPIPEDISSQLCSSRSNMQMKFDLRESHPQPTSIKSLPQQSQSRVETESSSNDDTQLTDYKQLEIELKEKYLRLDYPTITDAIPKPFCELVLLDINDIHVPVPVT